MARAVTIGTLIKWSLLGLSPFRTSGGAQLLDLGSRGSIIAIKKQDVDGPAVVLFRISTSQQKLFYI